MLANEKIDYNTSIQWRQNDYDAAISCKQPLESNFLQICWGAPFVERHIYTVLMKYFVVGIRTTSPGLYYLEELRDFNNNNKIIYKTYVQ